MSSFFTIRPEHFTPRLQASDFRIYRDGFCLMIINDKSRQGKVLSDVQVYSMIRSFDYPMTQGFIEALFTGESTIWTIPPDEQIIQYCIDQALIPHPYEEYGFS